MKKLSVDETRWFHPVDGHAPAEPASRHEETRQRCNELQDRLDVLEAWVLEQCTS